MFTKGLQSPKALVQHCTALALSKCLQKYLAVRDAFSSVSQALGEQSDESAGWTKRLSELDKEMRKRSPEFPVILSYVVASEKKDMLLESAMRLLSLYSTALPTAVREAKFDVGKLLLKAFNPDNTRRWASVVQLHVIRVLEANVDQFDWASKAGENLP